jgi:hypothetical protein
MARGELMSNFEDPTGKATAMKAILLTDPKMEEDLEALIEEHVCQQSRIRPDLVIAIANYNSPNQVILYFMRVIAHTRTSPSLYSLSFDMALVFSLLDCSLRTH